MVHIFIFKISDPKLKQQCSSHAVFQYFPDFLPSPSENNQRSFIIMLQSCKWHLIGLLIEVELDWSLQVGCLTSSTVSLVIFKYKVGDVLSSAIHPTSSITPYWLDGPSCQLDAIDV